MKSLFHLLLAIVIVSSGVVYGDLVAHYTFDDAANIGADVVGGRDGTAMGDAAQIAENWVGAGALALDGDGDYVDVGNGDFFTSFTGDGDGFSASAWVKTSGIPAASNALMRVFSMYNPTEAWIGQGWGFGLDMRTDGESKMIFTTYGIADYVSPVINDSFTFEEWNHIVVVFKSDGGAYYYINGVLIGSTAGNFSLNTTTQGFVIGALGFLGSGGQHQWFNGLIDDLRIYDNELDEAGIQEAYFQAPVSHLISPVERENVDVDVVLEWSTPLSYDPVGYNVYLGKDPNVAQNLFIVEGEVVNSYAASLDYDTVYYGRIDAFEPNEPSGVITHTGASWSFKTLPEVPFIEEGGDPESATVALGDTVEFSIVGRNQTDYAWYLSVDNANYTTEDDILVSNDEVFGIIGVQLEQEGYYYCVISNAVGEVASETALLMTQRKLAHWKLDGDLTDSAGNNDASLFIQTPGVDEEPNYVEGLIESGQAIDLSGTNVAVDIPFNMGLNTGSYSISLWANPTQPGGYQAVISNRDDAPQRGFIIYAAGANWAYWNGTGTGWGGTSNPLGNSTEVIAGEWLHIAFSFEATERVSESVYLGTKKLFINGVMAGISEGATYSHNTAQEMLIGAGGNEMDAHDYFFNGQVDDVEIWNYALDPIDISMIYTNQTGNSVCVDNVGLQFDFNTNCRIDLGDLATFAADWMNCRQVPDCF